MHKFDSNEDILLHFGKLGMKWGVRNDKRGGGGRRSTKAKPSKSTQKLNNHPAMKKHGKSPITEGRRISAVIATADHVDLKTGQYLNNSREARVARAVDKTIRAGLGTIIITGAVMTGM